jgi:hypothetical protein
MEKKLKLRQQKLVTVIFTTIFTLFAAHYLIYSSYKSILSWSWQWMNMPDATLHSVGQQPCSPLDPHILIYNRIPKAASTTMVTLLSKLSKLNNFRFRKFGKPYHNATLVRLAVDIALQMKIPTVICEHFDFPDIHLDDKIAYINVMREPVSRCNSAYYYSRYGGRPEDERQRVLDTYGSLTLDDCISQSEDNVRKCLNCQGDLQIEYLCGPEDGKCRNVTTSEALERAWSNVEQHYTVGLTEHLEETVALYESLYPNFFKGASHILKLIPHQKVTSGREEYKRPSEDTNKALERSWLAPDVELYKRATGRFWELYNRCQPVYN